jgi:hypothetical protein
VATLQDHFHARVELDSFHLSFGNSLHGEWGIWAVGKGLRIWPPATTDDASAPVAEKPSLGKPAAGASARQARVSASRQVADSSQQKLQGSYVAGGPVIRLSEFRFHVPLRYQPGKPLHIGLVELVGLDLDVPPRSHNPASAPKAKASAHLEAIEVDRIECSNVQLTIETNKPGKQPRIYEIGRARFSGYSSSKPMRYEADLTIPQPRGAVHAAGSFGPWQVADPGESPVNGDYKLTHADLGVCKGIAVILDSTGRFDGTLRDMDVTGQTSTPDFRLTHFGNALPLKTRFRAHVDGTNGDTHLDSVDATLGRAHFTTQGAIVRVAGDAAHAGGHDIMLAVQVDHSPIEDFLHLTSHSVTPLLTGWVDAKAALHIPPGKAPVHERLRLDGHFSLADGRFSNVGIQKEIGQLSLRGQGHPEEAKNTDPTQVISRMQGDFHLSGGTMNFPALDYSVPGAEIQLQGAYGLDGGTLDFAGTAKMEATVSQMVGGWKGMLLKPADRFFRKNGAGTSVAIHVKGTREHPIFGVELAGRELDLARHGGGNQ